MELLYYDHGTHKIQVYIQIVCILSECVRGGREKKKKTTEYAMVNGCKSWNIDACVMV